MVFLHEINLEFLGPLAKKVREMEENFPENREEFSKSLKESRTQCEENKKKWNDNDGCVATY